jgi:hypothetical protein
VYFFSCCAVLNRTLVLTGILRHTVLVKFDGLLLKPKIFVTKHKTRGLIYTLPVAREQRKRLYRITHMAVTTLIVFPFEPWASLSWKR